MDFVFASHDSNCLVIIQQINGDLIKKLYGKKEGYSLVGVSQFPHQRASPVYAFFS